MPSPRGQLKLPGIPSQDSLSVFRAAWSRITGGVGDTGLLWKKLECHRRSPTWGGAGGRRWGRVLAGRLSCHIPQAHRKLSWVPCPYLGRRCLLTPACGMLLLAGSPCRVGVGGVQSTPGAKSVRPWAGSPGGKSNPWGEKSLSK